MADLVIPGDGVIAGHGRSRACQSTRSPRTSPSSGVPPATNAAKIVTSGLAVRWAPVVGLRLCGARIRKGAGLGATQTFLLNTLLGRRAADPAVMAHFAVFRLLAAITDLRSWSELELHVLPGPDVIKRDALGISKEELGRDDHKSGASRHFRRGL